MSDTSMKSVSSLESSVTKLLMSTKQLLQVLTQWSRGTATERNVSDIYVQLGNDFKLVTRHFIHASVDIADLGDVPKDLRKILEAALREPASEQTLDKYLPEIRELIVRLLEKLKVKQATLRLNKSNGVTHPVTQGSRSSTASVTSSIHSLAGANISSKARTSMDSASSLASRTIRNSDSSFVSSNGEQHIAEQNEDRNTTENDPFTQLKNGTNLKRRASKRFSAYHMAKLANQTATDLASSPTSKNLSVPVATTEQDVAIRSIQSRNHSRAPSSNSVEYPSMTSNKNETLTDDTSDCEKTIFLKKGDVVKRCAVGAHLNSNKLRLLFVEKFAYSPGSENFPDIYMKDPQYDTFYETEEQFLQNVRDGTVFQLNKHSEPCNVDSKEIVSRLQAYMLESQQSLIAELKQLIENSSSRSMPPSTNSIKQPDSSEKEDEISKIKHELVVLKQIHSAQKTSLKNTVGDLLNKVQSFQNLSISNGSSSNREYMEKSHTKLSEISDNLLSKVDDLQDLIENMRKDVAIRGSKPSKKKIESVSNELECAKLDLDKMAEFIEIEKPSWKKMWEAELDRVCEEQQFMTLQEDLVFDLTEDLNKAFETFDLVRLCCKQQEKAPKKNIAAHIPLIKPEELNEVRDQLLLEIQSLDPDHISRVDAIKKAEKLREREREYLEQGAFEGELESFVENGNFKKAGGIQEVERLRKLKDEENLRLNLGII